MQSGCALIGGETAEMPGFYPEGEYDLAGFCVGIVNKKDIINGSQIKPGDKVIGLGSTGIHSNGFSLVRKLYQMDDTLNTTRIEQVGKTLGELLLEPTKIYVKSILDLIGKADVKGIAHITGGGFYENIPVSYTHLAQLVIDIIKDTTGKYIHKSLGESEPDTDWDKPSFY